MSTRAARPLVRLLTLGALAAGLAVPASGVGLDVRSAEFAAPPNSYTDVDGPAIRSARVDSYDDGRLGFTVRLNEPLPLSDAWITLSLDTDGNRNTGDQLYMGRDSDIVITGGSVWSRPYHSDDLRPFAVISSSLTGADVYVEFDSRSAGINPGSTFGVSFESLWSEPGQPGAHVSRFPDLFEDPWWALFVPTMAYVAPPPAPPIQPAPPAPATSTPAPRWVPLKASAGQVRRSGRVFARISGSTNRSERGRRVIVDRKVGARYVRLCAATVARNGRFTADCRVDQLARRGPVTLTLRARLPRTAGASAATQTLRLRVAPPAR